MLFSVIIPTFNRLDTLKAAVQSVQRQTFSDFEVIVVDDGSTDGSFEWASSIAGVRAFRQPNAGPSAARNLGARHAAGDYLAFLDSDDLFVDDALSTYATAIANHPSPSVLIGAWIETAGFASAPGNSQPLRAKPFADYLEAAANGHHFQSGSGAVRRDCFQNAGGFASQLRCAEDQDLALRIGTAPNCVVIESPTQVIYRRHSGSLTASLSRLIDGAAAIIDRERSGAYPGGDRRRAERRAAILRLAIPINVAAAKVDRSSWKLFKQLAPWAIAHGRWKYLFGFLALRLRHAADSRG